MNAHRPQPNEPDDRYLWEGRGEVDQTVASLERALSPLRYHAVPLALKARPAFAPGALRRPWLRAAASLVLVMTGIAAIAVFSQRGVDHEGWSVIAIEGAPDLGGRALADRGLLRVGQWIETDAQSKARIEVADIGNVTVDAHSRLRLVASDSNEHRLELSRGRIDAFITAPPRLFMVDTPTATAVDLGCAYTLQVEDSGASVLCVSLGWVSLERDGREVIVPRRAECRTEPDGRLGTPMFDDAPPILREAVTALDVGAGGAVALDAALVGARDRDSLTLWHLMTRERDAIARTRLIERLIAIEPLPTAVSLADVEAGDAAALALWRAEFAWSPP